MVTKSTSTDGAYTVDTYSGAGNTTWVVPVGVTSVQVLIQGGGGGGGRGGANSAGGGGGGGSTLIATQSVTPGASLYIAVGDGGLGGTSVTMHGAKGGNSTFNTTVATGGGYGGGEGSPAGGPGGSGGGAAGAVGAYGGLGETVTGGHDGGDTSGSALPLGGSGGGGYTWGGESNSGYDAGAGAAGRVSSITGGAYTFGSGQGGGTITSPPTGTVPVAQFSGNPLTGTIPLTVYFTNTSTGTPTNYAWTFGDGGTSTAVSPSHTYSVAGTYTVALTATNAYGSNTMTRTGYIVASTGGSSTYGAGTTYLGVTIGGGSTYGSYIGSHLNGSAVHIYTQAMMGDGDYVCTTLTQFQTALANCKSDHVIFIPSGTTITLSDVYWLGPAYTGVTIASDRGYGGSSGGAIHRVRVVTSYTEGSQRETTFNITKSNTRFTGLRIYSDDTVQDLGVETSDEHCPYNVPGFPQNIYTGVRAYYTTNLEVDNCELYGWSWRAVGIVGAGSTGFVHHCNIHHNNARGQGYGVAFEKSSGIAEGNIFDDNRHSVTSDGESTTSYEARYNIHNGNGDAFGGNHFDVHPLGGLNTYIHHNTLKSGGEDVEDGCIGLRGCPAGVQQIYYNDFETGCANPGFTKCSGHTRQTCWSNRVSGTVTNSFILYNA